MERSCTPRPPRPRSPLPDFRPAAAFAALRARAALTTRVRRFFAGRGYLEVETPALGAAVVVDAHLHPLVTAVHRDPGGSGGGAVRYLQTSPEAHMKRLVAAGSGPVWQSFRAFRDGESGPRHNPEFTLLEWYAPGETWRDQAAFTEALVRAAVDGGDQPSGPGGEGGGKGEQGPCRPPADPGPSSPFPLRSSAATRLDALPFPLLPYDDAFARFAGTAVLGLSAADLVGLARDRGVTLPGGVENDRDGLLGVLLAELVEPHLGGPATGGPCLLCDYPASQAALAAVRRDPGRPPVAERFELYADGVELCNGYQELTDADELRARFAEQNRLRVAHGFAPLPADDRLLAAMDAGLPACSGVALGFDRLAMWALGEPDLAGVLAFPDAVA